MRNTLWLILLITSTCLQDVKAQTAAPADAFTLRLTIQTQPALAPAAFKGEVLDGEFLVYSVDGMPQQYKFDRPQAGVFDKAYRLTVTINNRYEHFYLSIRNAHLGRQMNINADASDLDLSQRYNLVQSLCAAATPNVLARQLRAYLACRGLYYSYPSGDPMERFQALKGWFDASIAMASAPSSIFAFDKDVFDIVEGFERDRQLSPQNYKVQFAQGYIETRRRSALEMRLADVRTVPALIQAGAITQASDVNEYSMQILQELSKEGSAGFVANGISQDTLAGNKAYINSVAKSVGIKLKF